MSRKHPHRAGNQPVTRRYVAGVVRRARNDILSAIVYAPRADDPKWRGIEPLPLPLGVMPNGHLDFKWHPTGPSPERLERYAGPIGKES
jgi:hypothetical protein